MRNTEREKVVAEGLNAGVRMGRWIAVGCLLLFLTSGITRVEPHEVALILRFGRIVGRNDAERVHQPGLLFALPFPIDRVIRVPVRKEGEILSDELWQAVKSEEGSGTLDPTRDGYSLSGDVNILQVQSELRFRIDDPVAYTFRWNRVEPVLKDLLTSEMTGTLAEWRVEDALRLQRGGEESGRELEGLAPLLARRVGQRSAELSLGVVVTSVEIKEIRPPGQVLAEFRKTQSARIEKETRRREAEGFAAQQIPRSTAERDRLIKEAMTEASVTVSAARAETSVLQELIADYRRNPRFVRDRLYADTLAHVLRNVGRVDFVGPETRVMLSDETSGGRP